MESSFCSNNEILHCGGGPGTIRHTSGIAFEGGRGHRNIRIENNRIVCPAVEHAVFLSGAEWVTLSGNSLECSGEKLAVENCSKIEIRES